MEKNIKEGYKMKIETLEDAKKFMSPWDGWYCEIEDCGHTVGCDTGDMIEHLKTHSEKELKEHLKK